MSAGARRYVSQLWITLNAAQKPGRLTFERRMALDGKKVGACLLQNCQAQLAGCAGPSQNDPSSPYTRQPASPAPRRSSLRSTPAPASASCHSPAPPPASPAPPIPSTHVPHRPLPSNPSCLADEKCVENLVCLNTCNGKPDEAGCQIRCGDLYADAAVKAFNTCAVTTAGCVPQRKDEGLYPIPPADAVVSSFNTSEYMNGRWCALRLAPAHRSREENQSPSVFPESSRVGAANVALGALWVHSGC